MRDARQLPHRPVQIRLADTKTRCVRPRQHHRNTARSMIKPHMPIGILSCGATVGFKPIFAVPPLHNASLCQHSQMLCAIVLLDLSAVEKLAGGLAQAFGLHDAVSDFARAQALM